MSSDADADRRARAHGARAIADGCNLSFARGAFAPHAPVDAERLAHELGPALAMQVNLRALDLGGVEVDDAVVAHLTALPRLTRLRLVGTAVTDRTLARVAGWPALEALDVTATEVTEGGLARLAEARPDLALEG